MNGQSADPGSLLGQLQRGRGLGWLRAVAEPSSGRAALRDCLRSDPRWDAQVESRSRYYATLARALNLPASGLVAEPPATDERLTSLIHDTVVEMARRGDPSGLPTIRASILRDPSRAEWLLRQLSDIGAETELESLRAPLLEQVDDQVLSDLVFWAPAVPWDEWLSDDRRKAVDAVLSRPTESSQGSMPEADAEIEALLRYRWATFPRALLHRFRSLLTAEEVADLRRAASEATGPALWVSLRALGERQDPSAITRVEAILAANTIGRDRAAARRYLTALPSEITLPLARVWLGTEDDRFGMGANLMAIHATPDDLSQVRTATRAAWARRDELMYDLCHLLDAIGTIGTADTYPELNEAFEAVEYSYARRRAARALLRCDRSFPRRYGDECLWDCEAETRLLGVTAALDSPAVRRRLSQFAHDQHADEDVRSASVERLRSIAGQAPAKHHPGE